MKANYFATLAAVSMTTLALTTSCAQSDVNAVDNSAAVRDSSVTSNPINEENRSANPPIAQAGTSRVFYSERGIALGGTDPVAYFEESKPVQGSDRFSYQWGNATWHFSSAANRDLFVANPDKYTPEYGGFCAWAVSQNYTAPTDPNAWKIVNGKLYLNYNKQVQRNWERDISGHIIKADRNWPGLLDNLRQ